MSPYTQPGGFEQVCNFFELCSYGACSCSYLDDDTGFEVLWCGLS